MKARRIAFSSGSLLAVAIAFLVGKQPPRARADGISATGPMKYSGTLLENGVPVQGSRRIAIYLYSDFTASSPACSTEPMTDTAVQNGVFSLPLADTCTSMVQSTPDLWIEVVVDGQPLGRSKLGAVPFAVEAQRAAQPSGALLQTVNQLTAAVNSMKGGVVFFAQAACPPGWQPYPGAVGRYVVGSPANGANVGATVGQALGDGENRDVAAHTHGVSQSPHAHPPGNFFVDSNDNNQPQGGSNPALPYIFVPNTPGAWSVKGSSGAANANISIQQAGSVAGTTAPYVQLLACKYVGN